MDLSSKVLGASTAKQLAERVTQPVLSIGRNHFTRRQLANVDCFNFTAAANLSRILNDELHVKSISDVFHKVSPLQLALPRLGPISLAVLGAAFEDAGMGTLEQWYRKHALNICTFHTIKHRDEQDAARERREKRKRERRRLTLVHDRRHVKAGAA